MADDQQQGYKAEKGTDHPDRFYSAEKGTDYPKTPEAPEAPQPPRYPDPQSANPRVEEFPKNPPPPKALPVPESSGLIGSKVVLIIVGSVAVLGIAGGLFIYSKLQNVPFSFDDDKIIVEDSKGDKLEIDRRPTLPDDFPHDIPIFPTDIELTSSARLVDGDGDTASGSIFTWETKSVKGVVANYYKSALAANGWDVDQVTDTQNTSLITASKGDRGLNYLISQEDNMVKIVLTLVRLEN